MKKNDGNDKLKMKEKKFNIRSRIVISCINNIRLVN